MTSFDVTGVTPEQRRPLALNSLAKAQADAKAEDDEFTKRKDAFQAENIDAIKRVLGAGRDQKRVAPSDAEVQAAWSRFLEDGVAVARRVGDAKRKLASESSVVDMSINRGPARVDVAKYDGELVSKDVSVSAPVKLPNGQIAQKSYVITMQRAVLLADKELTGRWILTAIRDAAPTAATPQT